MASFSHPPDPKIGPNRFRLSFDSFELNLRSGELYKDGRRICLQAQPFQLLALLIEHAGEVVTREEVCRALWRADTFVDFDHGVAVAVNKIREALGDSADTPRFIETLPKRGYRFIAPVERPGPRLLDVPPSPDPDIRASLDTPPPAPRPAVETKVKPPASWPAR
jgi:DNA-binding winged helix-turn-helix (wHTH) protein